MSNEAIAWSALGVTTIVCLLIVWIASQESRGLRILGFAAVLLFVLVLVLSRELEATSVMTRVAGLTVIGAQATVLAIFTLWIASRQSRGVRAVGGSLLAALCIALTYGIILGPVWKANVIIIAAITLTWILGRKRR